MTKLALIWNYSKNAYFKSMYWVFMFTPVKALLGGGQSSCTSFLLLQQSSLDIHTHTEQLWSFVSKMNYFFHLTSTTTQWHPIYKQYILINPRGDQMIIWATDWHCNDGVCGWVWVCVCKREGKGRRLKGKEEEEERKEKERGGQEGGRMN